MKALVYHGPNSLSYDTVPDKEPKENEVKIAVKAVGICGSDVHGYLGLTGRRIPPMIMGHEFSGVVEKAGELVTKYTKGNRVTVYPVDYCGNCEMCRKGAYQLCRSRRQFGVLDVDGAFAEYICVPEKCCISVNDKVPFEIASLVEPAAVALHGVMHAGGVEGKTALVVGAGTIGLLSLVCLKNKGVKKVIVSDISDSRLKVAKKMGAEHVINPQEDDFKKQILSLTNQKGVDISIEAVGATSTVYQAVTAVKFNGTVVWLGNNKPMVEVNMQDIVTKEIKLFGSFLYGYNDFKEIVRIINQEKLDIGMIVSKLVTMKEGSSYFEKLAHDPQNLIKVILTNE